MGIFYHEKAFYAVKKTLSMSSILHYELSFCDMQLQKEVETSWVPY